MRNLMQSELQKIREENKKIELKDTSAKQSSNVKDVYRKMSDEQKGQITGGAVQAIVDDPDIPDDTKEQGRTIKEILKEMISKKNDILDFLEAVSYIMCEENPLDMKKIIREHPERSQNVITSINRKIIEVREQLRIGCDLDNTMMVVGLLPLVGDKFTKILTYIESTTGKILNTTNKLMEDYQWDTDDAKLFTYRDIHRNLMDLVGPRTGKPSQSVAAKSARGMLAGTIGSTWLSKTRQRY